MEILAGEPQTPIGKRLDLEQREYPFSQNPTEDGLEAFKRLPERVALAAFADFKEFVQIGDPAVLKSTVTDISLEVEERKEPVHHQGIAKVAVRFHQLVKFIVAQGAAIFVQPPVAAEVPRFGGTNQNRKPVVACNDRAEHIPKVRKRRNKQRIALLRLFDHVNSPPSIRDLVLLFSCQGTHGFCVANNFYRKSY